MLSSLLAPLCIRSLSSENVREKWFYERVSPHVTGSRDESERGTRSCCFPPVEYTYLP